MTQPKKQQDWKPSGELLFNILNWLLAEQLAGRAPDSRDVAKQFNLTVEQAEICRVRLEEQGEL